MLYSIMYCGLKMKTTLFFCIVLMSASLSGQDLHPDVQAALDWRSPDISCEFRVKRSAVVSDLDRKYERARNKYNKCMVRHLKNLTQAQDK